MKLILSYFLTTLVFFAIDLTWIGLVAKKFYWSNIGGLLKDDINWVAALVFYLLYIAGIFIFAILPAVETDSVKSAVIYGALFGFFCYATYDLTNLATLKGFP
ncbi:MAG: putative membrane protein, partial [Polaribacter sp.]